MSGRLGATVGIVLGFAAGLVVGVVGVVAVHRIDFFSSGPRFDTSAPTVVRQVRSLQRLETVVYAMDKIVSGGYDNRFLPRMLAGDRLLLVVYGDVTAGIDLGGVDASAVRVDGRSVTLALPAAQVFSTRIDNAKTRVYSRETGLFSRVDPDLESEVRKEAESQVRQAALDGGILPAAAANASTTLTSFLKGLGFEQVDVRQGR
jgi:hypothetical protein